MPVAVMGYNNAGNGDFISESSAIEKFNMLIPCISGRISLSPLLAVFYIAISMLNLLSTRIHRIYRNS
jgi:hypothetical protein